MWSILNIISSKCLIIPSLSDADQCKAGDYEQICSAAHNSSLSISKLTAGVTLFWFYTAHLLFSVHLIDCIRATGWRLYSYFPFHQVPKTWRPIELPALCRNLTSHWVAFILAPARVCTVKFHTIDHTIIFSGINFDVTFLLAQT